MLFPYTGFFPQISHTRAILIPFFLRANFGGKEKRTNIGKKRHQRNRKLRWKYFVSTGGKALLIEFHSHFAYPEK
jgi:hypothetical protein